jgi:hypothetical protein
MPHAKPREVEVEFIGSEDIWALQATVAEISESDDCMRSEKECSDSFGFWT